MSLYEEVEIKKHLTNGFDVPAFEQAIFEHGVKLVHFRAMRCPVGLVDRYDNRRPAHDHVGCSNGFVYTRAGSISALFTGNGEAQRNSDVGYIDGSSVNVTVQRFYDVDEENPTPSDVHVAPFDRFYLNEEVVVVPTWQLFESHISGREKLDFPVVAVHDLMDSEGKSYKQDVHFKVEGGYIVWTGPERPKFDAGRRQGSICSIRYTYRPYWYVKQLMHQIRVAQQDNILSGGRDIVRMPQAMVLQREYIFEKAQDEQTQKSQQPVVSGIAPAPRDGSFGPR